jgi:hypothetical protein
VARSRWRGAGGYAAWPKTAGDDPLGCALKAPHQPLPSGGPYARRHPVRLRPGPDSALPLVWRSRLSTLGEPSWTLLSEHNISVRVSDSPRARMTLFPPATAGVVRIFEMVEGLSSIRIGRAAAADQEGVLSVGQSGETTFKGGKRTPLGGGKRSRRIGRMCVNANRVTRCCDLTAASCVWRMWSGTLPQRSTAACDV